MIFNTNLIFLDFDGVLTAKCNRTYFCDDCSKYSYSESHLKLLENLCSKTDSKIIIASNWRRFDDNGIWNPFPGKSYHNPLPTLKLKLNGFIVGQLPTIRHITKSEALNLWFSENKLIESKRFVIFDDDLREGYQDSIFKANFIHIDSYLGLTKADCSAAEKILTKRFNKNIKVV